MSYTNAAADHGSETHQAMTGTDLTADSEQTRALYRERAHLIAVFASHYPARLAYNDEFEPEMAVLYVHTSAGQVTWHLHPDDLDLFGHVPWADTDTSLFTVFDGHDKDEALARLRQLAATTEVAR